MFERFWLWLTNTFGFIATRGVILTLAVGFGGSVSFYHLFVVGDSLTPLVIGELAVIGIIVSGATALAGYFTFGDNWPAMKVGIYWDEIHHKQDRAAKPSSRAHNKPYINEILDFLAQERQKEDVTKKEK